MNRSFTQQISKYLVIVLSVIYCLFMPSITHAQLTDSVAKILDSIPEDAKRYEQQALIATELLNKYEFEIADSLLTSTYIWSEDNEAYALQIDVCISRALSRHFQNDLEGAEKFHQEALQICRDENLPVKEIEALSSYANTLFQYQKPQEAGELLKKAAALMEKHETPLEVQSSVWYNLAGVNMVSGNSAVAMSYLRKAMRAWKEQEDWMSYAKGLNGEGVLFKNMGELDSAKIYYQKAVDEYRRHGINEPAILFNPIHNLSTLAIQAGELEESIAISTEALKLAEAAGNPIWVAAINRELGDIYLQLADLEQSRILIEKSISILKPLDRVSELGKTYTFLAKLEHFDGNYKAALEALENADKAFGFSPEQAIPYCGFLIQRGVVYEKLNRLDQALDDFAEGFKVSRKNEFPLWETTFSTGLASIYEKEGQLDSAEYYALIGFEIASQKGYVLEKEEAYAMLLKILPRLGKYEEAYQYAMEYNSLKDSVFKVDLAALASKERVKQNIKEAKEKQALAEEKATLLTSRNNLFLGLIVALGVILIGGVYFFRQLNKNKKQIEDQNVELAQLNQTKDKFFGIIAHDLRSPLIAFRGLGKQIDHYASKQNLTKIEKLAGVVDSVSGQLNSLLDNLLNWALLQTGRIPYFPKAVNLSDTVLDTFDIFQYSANVKNIRLETEINSTLTAYVDENGLKAMLRNLIGNSLKFTPEGGLITVEGMEKGDEIHLSIKDNGVGIPEEKLGKLFSLDKTSEDGTRGEKGTGLGLILTKELVELNQGKMQVESKVGEGSTVMIAFPIVN